MKVDAFEHFERIVGFAYIGDFYHNLVTFFVTFVIAQNYFVIFALLGTISKLILLSLVAKSNQKARATPKKLKNRYKSYSD